MNEEWLQEAMLEFVPATGEFDVAAIAQAIAGLGFNFRDPVDPANFVVTSDATIRDTFAARRKADPESMLPPTLLISVKPERVVVAISAFEEDMALTRQFVGWLVQARPCKVFNDHGEELAGMGAAPA